MSRNNRSAYDSRNRGSARQTKRSRWNIPRLIGAGACLIGAIILLFLIPKLFRAGEQEAADNAASRIAADGESGETTASGSAVTQATSKPVPTPEPTPKHREKAVALTFDDGPKSVEEDKGIQGTTGLLDTLKKYDAHATFFVCGYRCEINKEILKREVDEGHEVGNHTWDHPQLSKLSMSDVNSQIEKTNKIVKKLTDGYSPKLVRPPYGAISDEMRRKLKYPMIIWDVDTLDWKDINKYEPEEKAKAVLKVVKKEVKDGSIILMHDIHETSCEAAKLVIPWLQENGYDVLTVSELMERKGIDPKNGKVYASAE